MGTFEEIYRENFTRIYRFFYYRQVDLAQVEEQAQEVFLRFYKAYKDKQSSPEETVKILYGVAKNVYREWVRNAIKNQHLSLDEKYYDPGQLEEFEEDEQAETEFVQLRERLEEGLTALSPNVQAVMRLRFLENRGRAEVAAILGMKEKHVHVYQRRGIAALQKWVSKQVDKPKAVSPSPYSYTEDL